MISQAFAQHLLAANNLAGKFYAPVRSDAGYVREAISPSEAKTHWVDRLPPTDLRHYYGLRDGVWRDDLYLSSGAADVRMLRNLIGEDGVSFSAAPILDFGCGAGRMIRHLGAEAEATEVWGADIHADAIHWAQAHLTPFHFVATTTAPHLPFEDRTFGVIYAGSVWTHIGDLDVAWLLELRRILMREGRLFITISDRNSLKLIKDKAPSHASNDHVAALHRETGMLDRSWDAFLTRSTPWQQRVVYDRDAFVARLARWFDVRAVVPEAYGWQTGILLAKRRSGT